MALATLYIPVIVLKARKFALLFSFGSLFFLSRLESFVLYWFVRFFFHYSFSMLWGPVNHLKHLINVDRLPFSITYIITLIGTIFYSIWVNIFHQFFFYLLTNVTSFWLFEFFLFLLGSKLFLYDHLCSFTNRCSCLVNNSISVIISLIIYLGISSHIFLVVHVVWNFFPNFFIHSFQKLCPQH